MAESGRIGIAFVLVFAAGLCTTIGATAAFFSKIASPRMLAIGMSVSSGVMLYVSLVDIFMGKGIGVLAEVGWSDKEAYGYGTLMFFGGIFFTWAIHILVAFIGRLAGVNTDLDVTTVTDGKPAYKQAGDVEGGNKSGCAPADRALEPDNEVHLGNRPAGVDEKTGEAVDTLLSGDEHRLGMLKVGIMAAVAIFLHNLPEGMVTFAAYVADPVNGIAVAIAIALHNIPEGVVVAMPVYYATGSRIKGFMWAVLSGLSEPVGGLLAYLFLLSAENADVTYAALFCVVGGIMTFITIEDLIPTALKYDPHNKVTTPGIVFGMMVMAGSLVLFAIM